VVIVSGAASYALYERFNGNGWTLVQNNASGVWSTAARGDGSYAYYVTACNAGGCGPASTIVTVTVTNIPPPPATVQRLNGFSGSRETLTIQWSASTGATRYEVHCRQTGQVWSVNAPTTKQLVETGPVGEIPLYAYEVRACNAVGCSAWH
jgi:hypothetical protein